MSLWTFLRGTTCNLFGIGDGVDSDKTIEANIPGATKPALRFNTTLDKWEFSHDGVTFAEMVSPSILLAQINKEAVIYATTAALATVVYANGASGVGATLTGFAVGALSVDGASPSVGQRILIKNQATTYENGIYTVTATGSGAAVFVLTRTIDFNQSADIFTGDTLLVTLGTVNPITTWGYIGIDAPTMGSTAITFVQTGAVGATLGANTFSGAQNTARATVASHTTIADIWAAAGNEIDWTGTATTTAFPNAPQAGASRLLHCAGACAFTAGANMLIDGVASAATVTCAASDTVEVHAVSTTQFHLIRRKYDGTAQVSSGTSGGGDFLVMQIFS